MRVKPPAPPRVVWQEGMYLAPHHFQAQQRHFEADLAHAVTALFPFAWGVSAAAVDADALANGTLTLAHARGIFADGTPFCIPEADATPHPLVLAEHFPPTRDACVVHLVLPGWRAEGPNVAPGDDEDVGHTDARHDGGEPRYRAATRDLPDEAGGLDVAAVRVAVKNLRLTLDDVLPPDAGALPVARLRRDGTGHFVLDEAYVPPCLDYAASERLVGMLRGMLGMLEAKGAALAATLPAAPGATPGASPGAAPSAYAGNELATRWLLHAVRSAEAPLRHLAAVRHAHPERLWQELARLSGALCTFSLTTDPRDLPAYAHDDLGGCFAALERHLRTHLDVAVAAAAVVVPLRRASEVLHAAAVTDARCFAPGARWFLGVRAALPAVEVATRVPQLAKVCASKYVLELVRRAYPGMPVDHLPAPPAALAPRPGITYFELTLTGPCAQGLRETRELGVYLPEALPEAAVELAVLVPA